MGIEATVRWPGGSASVDAPADESGFWKAVAETFDRIDMPWKGDPTVAIEVSCPLGGCTLEARGRDEAWVQEILKNYNCRVQDVYLLTSEPDGKLYFAAMREDEA